MREGMTSAKTAVVSSVAAAGVVFMMPTVTEAAFGDQTLRSGMQNSEVKTLQEKLKAEGHYTYSITGVFGPLTKQAVESFQREKGLQVDGIAGPQTFGALSAKSSSTPSSSNASSSSGSSGKSISGSSASALNTQQILRQGSTGSEVEKLQIALGKSGFYKPGHTTGSYGDSTRSAVRDFQRARSLQVDGIAGPQTLTQLNKEINASSNTNTSEYSSASLAGSTSILRSGSQGGEVRSLQTKLKELNYFSGSVSGTYNTATQSAVRDFQRAAGIGVDGIAGPQTFRALENAAPAKTSSNSSNTSSGSSSVGSITAILRSGSTGDNVRSLQSKLKELNYFSGSVSGTYNAATQSAVRDFQKAAGIGVDGIAGPQTFRAMENASPVKTSSNSNTSSGNSTSNSSAILRQGATGEQVRSLQTTLRDLKYYSGSISGTFGSQTAAAVRDFQKAAGLGVDGIAGPNTFKALETASPKSGSASSAGSGSTSKVLLQHGARNDDVRELQDSLKAAGFFSGTSTGYFGDVTKKAVTDFQKKWNLVADGIVTQATWSKIQEVSSVHLGSSSPNQSSGGFNTLNLIADASNLIGVPYRWGGTTTAGFDCSGFTQYVYKKNGKNLPRTAAQQYNAGSHVSDANRRVGDMVFFETYTSGPSHNGIYIGNGQFIHAGSSTGVTIASLNTNYWKQRYIGTRRH
ncbi:peptidoglycan-binding protein [Alkalicoccus daliensis]|uniref:Cell wall-associated hydrolase, NlpC family n=1 Tax=Alkalicoccus daliensis TaxID=745820 RepID=A0A1H0GJM9_9BACI|nr:peptidoglycan-binding protein [Alkalicoccus daliensis]SDO07195.1 Cell wall-associated hydrolase, NlpC family [Alkalicoccus daliensis]